MPIQLPDRMLAAPEIVDTPPPPVDPIVAREQQIADTTRAEEALNGFLAAKQHALFEAPDAFYRTEGSDAIHAAPVILDTLSKLRDDHLDGLANDAQRNRLGSALDAHMELARDDIARHVAEQSLAWQRKVAQDRIALLQKEAAYHHNDDGLVGAIGHAAATAARAHARVGDGLDQQAEDAAAATARSGVLGAAIQARLDRGDTDGANALFTQVRDQLDHEHAAPLQGQIKQVQTPPLLVHPEMVGPGTIEPEAATPSPDDAATAETGLAPAQPEAGNDHGAPSQGQIESVWAPQAAPDDGPSDRPIVPVNHSPDDAAKVMAADPQLAQAPAAARPTKPATKPGPKVAKPTPSAKLEAAPAPATGRATPNPVQSKDRETEESERQRERALNEAFNKIERDGRWGLITRTLPIPAYPGSHTQAPLPQDWAAGLEKIRPNLNYAELTRKAAEKYGIPPELLARLLHRESTYNRYAKNGEHLGIPQMGEAALTDLGINPDTFLQQSPEAQINAGAAYLAKQYKMLQDWPKAVAAYHSGGRAIADWAAGRGPNYEFPAQRRALELDGDKTLLPKVRQLKEAKITAGAGQWLELENYLPYVFMGDPNRYDTPRSKLSAGSPPR